MWSLLVVWPARVALGIVALPALAALLLMGSVARGGRR